MTTATPIVQQRIHQCQGMVHSLARKVHASFSSLDLDDLVGYGQVGLLEAVRDFDESKGARFSTYAYYRIRGAIYDGLSKLTWASRAEYRRLRFRRLAADVLQSEGESPGVRSRESESGWFRDVTEALAVVHLALGGIQGASADPADPAPEPSVAACMRELCSRLATAIEDLPHDARMLIRATYFEGLSLQEAGKRLGVSRSWASRLHSRTLRRLARSMSIERTAI